MTQGRRSDVLAAVLEHAGALLVTSPANVRYLTGFTGSNGQLLLGESCRFFTDGRYIEQSRTQVPDVERVIYSGSGFDRCLQAELAALGVSRLAFEAGHTTVAAHRRRVEALAGTELVATNDLVERRRARKDAQEIAAIRRAQSLTEHALVSALEEWRGGTEAELALDIETRIRRTGAQGVSFEVIVATGEHAALPHARPRDAAVPARGVLLIDVGARVDGYCSDMTRTFLRGAADPMPKVHAAVVRALEAGCDAVRPGARAADVDAAARDVLAAEGLADLFTHTTGHGVGLDIHEAPRLSRESEDVLEPGMVVTVEPGVYIAGVGGVRVEDLLVVTEDGADNLTTLPR